MSWCWLARVVQKLRKESELIAQCLYFNFSSWMENFFMSILSVVKG
jgi:hypothetical protein